MIRQLCFALPLAVIILLPLCTYTHAKPSQRNRIATTASSAERETTRNFDTATSMTQPLSEYLQSIGWWSLANLSSDAFNTSARNHIDQLFNKAKILLHRDQRRHLAGSNGNARNKPFIYAIASAALLARAQCKTQFQNERWDCPDSGHLQRGKFREVPYYTKLVEYTTRQTAFLTALTSAALMSSVMYTCSKGMNNVPCVCDPRYRAGPMITSQIPRELRIQSSGQISKSYEWGGCSDNIDFGRQFVTTFTRKPQSGNDQRFIANKHNRDAGLRVVENSIETKCQCHGVSGSCQARVCFRRQSQFSRIAEELKRKFDTAIRVMMNAYSSNPPTLLHQAGNRAPEPTELVYTDETRDDDFCNAHPIYGTPGTQRRVCKPDIDSNAMNYKEGCAYLCCGRGYSVREAIKQLPDQFVLAPNNEVRVIPGRFKTYMRYECY